MKKEFIEFLRKEKALIPFITNLASTHNQTLSQHMNHLKEQLHLSTVTDKNVHYYYIDTAFQWSFTKEGYSYWQIIHERWYKLASEHDK